MNTILCIPHASDLIRGGPGCTVCSLEERLAESERQNKWMLRVLKSIADETYDPWTNGAEAGRIARSVIESLQTHAHLKGNDE